MVEPYEDKTGYAQTIVAYMSEDLKTPKFFIGRTHGKIVEPRGSRDFGWDPSFQPDCFEQTYAEMDKEVKNKISHRFKALVEMKKYFDEVPEEKKE